MFVTLSTKNVFKKNKKIEELSKKNFFKEMFVGIHFTSRLFTRKQKEY